MANITENVSSVIEMIKNDIYYGGGIAVDSKNGSEDAVFAGKMLELKYGFDDVCLDELQNLNEIELKMIKYMENEGIEFKLLPDDESSEAFICTKAGYKCIVILPRDLEDANNERMYAIAHELGHYLDLKYSFKFNSRIFQLNTITEEEIVKAEVIAWYNAKLILEALGLEDFYEYTNEAVKALNTYIYGGTKRTIEFLKRTGEFLMSRYE